MSKPIDVAVIGGGIAGLTAATYLARDGLRVTLLERATAVGGRARTRREAGFSVNLGAHALYRGGPAERVLKELGVPISGRPLPRVKLWGLDGGGLLPLPGGLFSLLRNPRLGAAAKFHLARVLAGASRLDTSALDRVTVNEWLERVLPVEARAWAAAFLRLSTYCAAHDTMSAAAAIEQLKLAVSPGVVYLDHGWQSLVDDLRSAAHEAGVELRTDSLVRTITHDGSVQSVHLDSGERLEVETVIATGGPRDISKLVDEGTHPHLSRLVAESVPLRAAVLDVALSALPRADHPFVLGVDCPLYLSVHSIAADLAPEGGAVIHVAKYLDGGPADVEAIRGELEGLLDRAQPGWREVLVWKQFLPAMTVSHRIVTAAGGGMTGRPDSVVPGVDGLYLAGDWVGPEGMLSDAAFASARSAAMHARARRSAKQAA